jgi:hypothetical protein
LRDWSIGGALDHEPRDTCRHLSTDMSADTAPDLFQRDLAHRVFATLVTTHRDAKQKLLGLITPWDAVTGFLCT